MKKYKEGVDYEWRKVEGANAKSRHFFTKSEKGKRSVTTSPVAPKRKAVSRAKHTEVKRIKTPEVYTNQFTNVKGGRGDGVREWGRRTLDSMKTRTSGGSGATKHLLRSKSNNKIVTSDNQKTYRERKAASRRKKPSADLIRKVRDAVR